MESLTDADVDELTAVSRRVRRQALEIFVKSGRGHYGGCFSVVEILVLLYGKILRVDPTKVTWPDRDRVILSKAHANGVLCPVLAHYGFFEEAELDTYGQLGGRFGMHVDMHMPGCDMSAGSLGHGLAIGIGMALAGRVDRKDFRVYVVLGDGECDEGTIWEAALVASHHKIDNLIAIIDRNRLSLDGPTEEILALEPLAEKWRSFGWHVIEVDGHDFRQLYKGLKDAQATSGRPTLLIANTVKGKGVSFMEGDPAYHASGLAGDQLRMARAELAGGTK